MPELTQSQLQQAADFATSLADTARQVIMAYFRQPVMVDRKADTSPVTEADRATERALRDLIEARFPDHGILGEEYGHSGAGQPLTWVLDPIDGTKSFINGMPTFGSLIALLDGSTPVLGVIESPALGERWVGARGLATHYNGASCRSSDCRALDQASLLCTSIDMFKDRNAARFEALSRRVRMRRFGGDCYAYGLLALGFVDLVVEATMAPYDYLALAPVVAGAGGVISDWRGQPLQLESDGTVLAAATPQLHAAALALLSGD